MQAHTIHTLQPAFTVVTAAATLPPSPPATLPPSIARTSTSHIHHAHTAREHIWTQPCTHGGLDTNTLGDLYNPATHKPWTPEVINQYLHTAIREPNASALAPLIHNDFDHFYSSIPPLPKLQLEGRELADWCVPYESFALTYMYKT